jgi:ADP-ribose pyrophosphatase
MSDEPFEREVYVGRILTLRLRYLLGRDGRRHLREIVEHTPGAATVALDDSDNVLLVRQPRPAVGARLLELPAGLVDPGEEPIDCARRELQEETGYVARRVEPLVSFYTSPGFTNELIHIFVATHLEELQAKHDEGEEIEVVRMLLDAAIEQVLRGEISDAKTVTGLLAYAARASGAG